MRIGRTGMDLSNQDTAIEHSARLVTASRIGDHGARRRHGTAVHVVGWLGSVHVEG
jgi:hypothetical protein